MNKKLTNISTLFSTNMSPSNLKKAI